MRGESKPLYRFLLLAFLNNVAVGAYIVLIAWQATHVGGVEGVGTVFMMSSITGIFLGPVLGRKIDGHEKKSLIALAQGIKVLFGAIPIFVYGVLGFNYNLALLMAMAPIMTLSNTTYGLSMSPIIKATFDSSGVKSIMAYISTFRELGIVAGSSMAGYALLAVSFEKAFLLITVSSLASLVLVRMLPLTPIIQTAKKRPQYLQDIYTVIRSIHSENWGYFAALIICLTGLGAFVNTILPEFVQAVRGGTSALYGNIEAAWSFGGVAVGIIAGRFANVVTQSHRNPTLILLGTILILVPELPNETLILMVHFVMGGLFSYGFIASQAGITNTVKQDQLGVVFGSVGSMGALLSVMVYLSPKVFNYTDISVSYILGGLVVICLGVLLMISAARRFQN